MTTKELEARVERLAEQIAKKSRKLERAKSTLADAIAAEKTQKVEKQNSDLVIEIAGLRFAKVNLGTDIENPMGRYHTFEEALEACPDGWRLPTDEEYTQLIKRTTQEVVIREGIRGMLFTDKKTNVEMFLPFAGIRNNNSGALSTVGSYAYCWSSTRSGAYYSYRLYFDYTGAVYLSTSYYRSYGFPVRCVLN